MLSWYSITIAIGIPFIPFTVLVIVYLLWSTKQLLRRIDSKWADVKLSSGDNRMTAVRMPGSGKILELKIGGTVSSTSSVHPTKETWLNIRRSDEMSPNNSTERTTMRDLQEMFDISERTPDDEEDADPKTKRAKRKPSFSSV